MGGFGVFDNGGGASMVAVLTLMTVVVVAIVTFVAKDIGGWIRMREKKGLLKG